MSDLAEMLASAKAQGYAEGIDDLAELIADNCDCPIKIREKCYSATHCIVWTFAEQLKEKNNE